MEKRKLFIGAVGVLGIWLCNGIALPMVKQFSFSPQQLMAVRGIVTALLAIWMVSPATFFTLQGQSKRIVLLLGASFAVANLCLYQGIKEWGPSLTIIVIAASPIVNFFFTRFVLRTQVDKSAMVCLFAMMLGVFIALPWDAAQFSVAGLLWSTGGALTNGLYYEALATTNKTNSLMRCFVQASCVAVTGIAMSATSDWSALQSDILPTLILFALLAGLFYFIPNSLAFDNLPKDKASVAAQGETPIVVIVSGWMLGEYLSVLQWAGMLLTVGAAFLLIKSIETSRASRREPWTS